MLSDADRYKQRLKQIFDAIQESEDRIERDIQRREEEHRLTMEQMRQNQKLSIERRIREQLEEIYKEERDRNG